MNFHLVPATLKASPHRTMEDFNASAIVNILSPVSPAGFSPLISSASVPRRTDFLPENDI